MSTILISVICNVVAVLVLLGCLFGASRNNWKVSLLKLSLTLCCGVVCYFATPILSEMICAVSLESTTLGVVLANLGISIFSINSIIFTLLFVLGYGINCIVSNIFRHSLIKSCRNKSENIARMRRAKSINPRAEKLARRAAWRQLISTYKENNKGLRKIISLLLSVLTGVILSIIVLMPFGYIFEDLNKANSGNKAFLEKGFDYTLNGVIDEKIDFKVFDWLISADEQAADEDPEEDIPCEEHSFVEGICEYCGETEVPVVE